MYNICDATQEEVMEAPLPYCYALSFLIKYSQKNKIRGMYFLPFKHAYYLHEKHITVFGKSLKFSSGRKKEKIYND